MKRDDLLEYALDLRAIPGMSDDQIRAALMTFGNTLYRPFLARGVQALDDLGSWDEDASEVLGVDVLEAVSGFMAQQVARKLGGAIDWVMEQLATKPAQPSPTSLEDVTRDLVHNRPRRERFAAMGMPGRGPAPFGPALGRRLDRRGEAPADRRNPES